MTDIPDLTYTFAHGGKTNFDELKHTLNAPSVITLTHPRSNFLTQQIAGIITDISIDGRLRVEAFNSNSEVMYVAIEDVLHLAYIGDMKKETSDD